MYNFRTFSDMSCRTKHVTERINAFLTKAEDLLRNMKDEDLWKHLSSMIAKREEEDASLEDEVDRNWWEVVSRAYVFDRLQREVHYTSLFVHENRSVCVT